MVAERIPTVDAETYAREQRRARSEVPELWDLLDAVKDPEIPAVSLWEMGILQDIERREDRIVVTITPTYCGCPAMSVMAEDVRDALRAAGYRAEVQHRLSPAWTTEWMSAEARRKLRAYGIAPPGQVGDKDAVSCPRCGATTAECLSEFGSTACKALYRCSDCGETFDYFKTI